MSDSSPNPPLFQREASDIFIPMFAVSIIITVATALPLWVARSKVTESSRLNNMIVIGCLQLLHAALAVSVAWRYGHGESMDDKLDSHWLLSGMFTTTVLLIVSCLTFIASVANEVYSTRRTHFLFAITAVIAVFNLYAILDPGPRVDTLGAYMTTVTSNIVSSGVPIVVFCILLNPINNLGPQPRSYYALLVKMSAFLSLAGFSQMLWSLALHFGKEFATSHVGMIISFSLSEGLAAMFPFALFTLISSHGIPEPYYVSSFENDILAEAGRVSADE